MNNAADRQKIILALAGIRSATQQERLSYGAYVKELRQALGIRQEELADASGVSARTLRNIEGQATAGQADKLINIFRALGLELEHRGWSPDVERYLEMIAPLIEKISPGRRLATMTEVIRVLSDAISAPNVGGAGQDRDLYTVPIEEQAAASTDDSAVDPSRGEA